MKRVICALFALLMIVLLVGCGATEEESATSISESVAAASESAEVKDTVIDVDLTKLSSTMVYSEVYNMMTTPTDYLGKQVKMTGQFAIYQPTDANGQPVDGQIYFACIIADATACCQQGLEFILAGDYSYPDDYPELGTDITVSGEFQTYMEGTQQYCHLINAEFTN